MIDPIRERPRVEGCEGDREGIEWNVRRRDKGEETEDLRGQDVRGFASAALNRRRDLKGEEA